MKHLNDLRGATVLGLLKSALGVEGRSWCGEDTTVETSVTESQIGHCDCIGCLEAFAAWHRSYVDAANIVIGSLRRAAERS